MNERTRTVGVGVGGGVVAAFSGYLVTYLAVGSTVRESVPRQLVEALGGDLPTWKVVGWVFFNAHAVSTRIPGLFGSQTVNFLSEGSAFPAVLYAVPPLLLLLVGFGVASVVSRPSLAASASLVAGYFVVALALTFLATATLGEATLGPELVPALVLAGVAYPLVFGGVGMLAARVVNSA